MAVNTKYQLFQCESCSKIDCLKTIGDEQFNPIMNCWNCKEKDSMLFQREITSDEHEHLFRGGPDPTQKALPEGSNLNSPGITSTD